MRTHRFLALAAAGFLAGCGGNMSDLQSWVSQVKAHKSTAIEPIPQMKQYEAFAYAADDRRDPFVPVPSERAQAQAGAGGAVQPDMNRNREPLEEFPLDALRMKGVIDTPQGRFALVQAPDAIIHRVTTGDHMGQNFGKITKITETEIVLTEIVPDGLGGWMQRPAELALAE